MEEQREKPEDRVEPYDCNKNKVVRSSGYRFTISWKDMGKRVPLSDVRRFPWPRITTA